MQLGLSQLNKTGPAALQAEDVMPAALAELIPYSFCSCLARGMPSYQLQTDICRLTDHSLSGGFMLVDQLRSRSRKGHTGEVLCSEDFLV